MTATLHRPPSRRRNPQERRLGFVYAYDTLKVDRTSGVILDGSTEVGYVGKTVQKLTARDDQHRGLVAGPDGEPPQCQPFSDLIVGSIRVVEQGMWTERELDERETFWIAQLRPAYNTLKQQRGNPNRIMLSDARRHRDVRDVAKDLQPREWPAFRSGWKPAQTSSTRPARQPQVRTTRLPERWRRRLLKAAIVATAYVVTVGLLWLGLGLYVAPRVAGEPLAAWLAVAWGLATECFLLPLARKPRRKDDRRLAAGIITVAVFLATGALLGWATGSVQ